MKPEAKEILRQYPFTEGQSGIDLGSVVDKLSDDPDDNDYVGPVRSGSGRPLKLDLKRSKIEVWDQGMPPIGMKVLSSDRLLSADLSTRKVDHKVGETSEPHPDMHGRKFLTMGVEYLREQGEDHDFLAEWHGGSLNERDYLHGIRDGLSEKQAAQKTWTGEVLGELSFQVSDIWEEKVHGKRRIKVRFRRTEE